jgi:hypothetical protein
MENLLEKILKDNPHIDRSKVLRYRQLTERLRKTSLRPRGYRLALPMAGARVRALGNDDDRHAVHLRPLP